MVTNSEPDADMVDAADEDKDLASQVSKEGGKEEEKKEEGGAEGKGDEAKTG